MVRCGGVVCDLAVRDAELSEEFFDLAVCEERVCFAEVDDVFGALAEAGAYIGDAAHSDYGYFVDCWWINRMREGWFWRVVFFLTGAPGWGFWGDFFLLLTGSVCKP